MADRLVICIPLADVVPEDSEATTQENREGSGWLNGLSPGPRGQSFKKIMSLLFPDLYLGKVYGNAQYVLKIVDLFSLSLSKLSISITLFLFLRNSVSELVCKLDKVMYVFLCKHEIKFLLPLPFFHSVRMQKSVSYERGCVGILSPTFLLYPTGKTVSNKSDSS